jgi:hypothetical protein
MGVSLKLEAHADKDVFGSMLYALCPRPILFEATMPSIDALMPINYGSDGLRRNNTGTSSQRK